MERGKKAGAEWQRVVNTPSGRWVGGSIHPPARARDAGETPQPQLSGHPSPCQVQEPQKNIPKEEQGKTGTKPLNHQLALLFFP